MCLCVQRNPSDADTQGPRSSFEQDSSGIRQRDFLEKAVDALKFKLSLDKKTAQAQNLRIMQVCKDSSRSALQDLRLWRLMALIAQAALSL